MKFSRKKLTETLKDVTDQVASLPSGVLEELEKSTGADFASMVEELSKSTTILKGSVDLVSSFVQAIQTLLNDFDDKDFRRRIKSFFASLLSITDIDLPLPIRVKAPAALKPELLDPIFDNIPAFVLLGASLALDTIDGWDETPARMIKTLKKLSQLETGNLRNLAIAAVDEELCLDALETRALVQMVLQVIDTVQSVLPRDMSITLSVVGAGVGTEMLGNPIRTVFQPIKLILQWVDNSLTFYLDLAEMGRHILLRQKQLTG